MMTDTQWIIYIYGIYPEGGWTVLWMILLVAYTIFIAAIGVNNISESKYRSYKPEDYLLNRLSWFKKYGISLLLGFMIFLSNLVPPKNTFLALAATPTVVKHITESMDHGKLKKLDKLFDLVLDKAEEELKE